VLILAMAAGPSALAIMAAQSGQSGIGTGLLLWALLADLGFVVFLAIVYVVAYIASAGWHDARNVRDRR
jgi:hypothetical protein